MLVITRRFDVQRVLSSLADSDILAAGRLSRRASSAALTIPRSISNAPQSFVNTAAASSGTEDASTRAAPSGAGGRAHQRPRCRAFYTHDARAPSPAISTPPRLLPACNSRDCLLGSRAQMIVATPQPRFIVSRYFHAVVTLNTQCDADFLRYYCHDDAFRSIEESHAVTIARERQAGTSGERLISLRAPSRAGAHIHIRHRTQQALGQAGAAPSAGQCNVTMLHTAA